MLLRMSRRLQIGRPSALRVKCRISINVAPMLVHPQFDPIAISLGPIAIRWYGLMYLIAFILFMVLGRLRARRNVLSGWIPRDIDDLLFYGVLGVILGGRLGYVLFYLSLIHISEPTRPY